MTAAEIRTKGIASPAHCYGGDRTPGTDPGVALNLGLIFGALQEIAAQLAELNAKLEPDAIFAALTKKVGMIEKMPPDQHRRNR